MSGPSRLYLFEAAQTKLIAAAREFVKTESNLSFIELEFAVAAFNQAEKELKEKGP